jgi:hypothetical protein
MQFRIHADDGFNVEAAWPRDQNRQIKLLDLFLID